MPAKTHDRNRSDGLAAWSTLREAIGKLREDDPEFYRFCPSKEKYLALVPEGGNWRTLSPAMQRKALGKAFVSWGGRCGFFRRLAWDKPSPALTTRPDSKATSLCHPDHLRPLTVGEYARIQQFPPEWQFAGMVRKKYEQVGNAVPLGLGEAIGRALLKATRSRKKLDRNGTVECFNLDLLESLCRRPKTIVNPPRMRDDTEEETITTWYNSMGRHRNDAFSYVPREFETSFAERFRNKGDRRSSADTKSRDRHRTRKTRSHPVHRQQTRKRIRLASAE